MKTPSLLLIFVAATTLVFACNGDSEPEYPPIQVNEPDLANASEVGGTVTFEGRPPSRRPIAMSADAACKQMHGSNPLDERIVVTNGKLRDVLVYVSKGFEQWTFDWLKTSTVLDQVGCVYVPHVLAVRTYQPILIKNSDNTTHNVNTTGSRKGQGFNRSMHARGSELHRRFKKRELRLPVRCQIHPWMNAWIHVLDHPYFAVTGENGRWTFPRKLPPGTYTLTALHPKLGKQERQVTVEADKSASYDFSFTK